jgi:hypothetical protein
MAGEKIVQQALKAVRELNPLGLFSRATEEASKIPQAKGTPQQMRAALLKQGVKPDELKWTGFDDWAKGRQSVTRDEVADFLRRNEVQVNETRLADNARAAEKRINELENVRQDRRLTDAEDSEYRRLINILNNDNAPVTKFERYTLPGGENYRELLLKRPEVENDEPARFSMLGGQGMRRVDPNNYLSAHYPDPNILAHLRLKDRTDPEGRRILHVEEIQSDWGQEGRKTGFDTPERAQKIAAMQEEERKLQARYNDLRLQQLKIKPQSGFAGEPLEYPEGYSHELAARLSREMRETQNEIVAIRRNMPGPGIPSAPFIESTPKWTDLALKRALREAAEGGYDALAWTPGAQQAARYPGVGEQGMIGYYDKIVPTQLQKLVRPMDPEAQFGATSIQADSSPRSLSYFLDWAAQQGDTRPRPTLGEVWSRGESDPDVRAFMSSKKSIELPSLNITPAMREKIKEGLPLFTMVPGAVGLGMAQPAQEEPRDGFAGGGVIRRAIEAARKAVAPEDLLMGIHNTAEGRKLDMIERLGGLPAPSIAITKPSQGYTPFGDISLIAPVEMVTPSRKTPVFGSDVYSPRFPNVEGDQIFRGFTPAGNRRYAPLTMENVLREMKGNVRGGESFNYGPASIRAQVTPQFGSLPEMQAAREKIIPSSEFGAQKDMSTEMMERLRERFEPYFKPTDPYRRSWSAFPEVLTDYARTGRPSEFAYDYKDLPAEALTDARSFLSHLRDMPTEYFEAKPQRAVPLSEFSGAVVPADVPGSVVDRIRNMGISRIEEYGDDASRAAALMKFVGEQGFADGGAVDFNDAPNYALDNDAAFFDMSRVFPPAPAGKLPNRAENIPLNRSFRPAQPEIVDRALDVVRSEPRPMDIKVSRQAPPPPRPVPRPAPVRAPARAPAAPDTSESRRLWEIYNETGNPADFVRASNAMRAGRAEGGRLLEDRYPTHYLPNVGRQVMADGGGAMDAPLTTPDQRLDVIDTYLEDAVDQSLNRGPAMQFNRLPAPSEPHTTPNERIGVLATYGGDVADQGRYRDAVPMQQPAVDPNRQSYLEAFGPPQTSAGLTANAPTELPPGEYGRQKLDRIMTGIFGPNARERAISAAQSLFAPPDPSLPPGEYGRRRLDTLLNNLVDPALLGSKATLGVEDIRGGVVLPDRAGVPLTPRDYGALPSSQSFQSTVAPPAPAPAAKATEIRSPYGQFSDADVEALANMIAGEASTQGRESMAQVGQVALNRALMNYNDYGNTLQAQLSRPRQFLGYNSPNAKAIMAGETPQQQAIAQQAREIARGLIEGTIQPKFANATDFNQGSTSFNAKRGAANAARLGSHTFFNASPAYAKRLERAKRERQGRATGGIVDDALGVVRELPQQEPVRVAMFAGEGAVGAPLQSLDLAKRLIAEGASPEEAYRGSASDGSTGWFQGADGRWRFEVSDKDATINPENFERLRAGNPVRPSELLSHPRLFEMYPNLNKINLGLVSQSDYDQGLMGSFNNRTNTLSLPPDPKQAQSTMLHELQHGIQNSENFGTGGGSTAIKEALKSEVLLEQMRASRRAMEMRKQVMDRMFDTNYADPEQLSKFREFQAENERQIASEQGRIPALKQRFEELNPTGRWGSLKDYELYRRLAGETEARNVQNRMQMDLDERRASFPGTTQEYPNEEQYVRMRGGRADGGEVESAMNVVRGMYADGGSPAAEKYEAMPGFIPRLLGVTERAKPDADIQQYENRMRAIAQQPADIQSMTHAPNKPMRPIDIEGGFIGKRRFEVPYDVAGPLSEMAQTAYSLKTLPFYFTPLAPFAAAADFGEAAIDTKNALNEGDYLGAGVTGALGVAMPAVAYRKQAADAVRSGLEAARRFVAGNPGTATAVGAGAATLAPEEAEASGSGLIRRGLDAVRGVRAYHGSPHDFNRFDLSKIGTGEGAQAYGHGLYFAENEDIARHYRDALANPPLFGVKNAVRRAQGLDPLPRPGPGHMYEVNIRANPDQFLDWDKPLREQPEAVRRLAGWSPDADAQYRAALKDETDRLYDELMGGPSFVSSQMPPRPAGAAPMDWTGAQFYESSKLVPGDYRDKVAATERLREAGVPGIKYLDAGSRNDGEGSRNYVVFDDKLIDILRKYGIPLMAAGTGASALQDVSSPREETVP